MTTTEKNGARDEYFDQLMNLAEKFFTESFAAEAKNKEKILSITYDTSVALQKRVEELEAALSETILLNLHQYPEGTVGNRVYKSIQSVLTKQS